MTDIAHPHFETNPPVHMLFNGFIWYNETEKKFKCFEDDLIKDLRVAAGGVPAPTDPGDLLYSILGVGPWDILSVGTSDQVLKIPTGGGVPAYGKVKTGSVDNSAITYPKIQNVSANKVLGSIAGGVVSEIDCTPAGRDIIGAGTAALQRNALGLGNSATKDVGTGSDQVAAGNHNHNHSNLDNVQGGSPTADEFLHLTAAEVLKLDELTREHNELDGLQGGSPTADEFIHLTFAELVKLDGLTREHNELDGLQGGSPTNDEYNHLTDAQVTKLDNIQPGAQKETFDRTVESGKTTFTADDSPRIVSNEDADAYAGTYGVVYYLPAAQPGLIFSFIDADVDTRVEIVAAAGDTIRLNDLESISGGVVYSENQGCVIKLVAVNSANWYAVETIGDWSLETT